jgi:hypothetical protein
MGVVILSSDPVPCHARVPRAPTSRRTNRVLDQTSVPLVHEGFGPVWTLPLKLVAAPDDAIGASQGFRTMGLGIDEWTVSLRCAVGA